MSATTTRRTNLILFLGLIIIFSIISFVAANTAFIVANEIYSGVTVADIPVGGLSVNEAEQKIREKIVSKMSQPIELKYKDKSWSISADEISLSIDASSLAQEAYKVGRNGNMFHQLQERYLTVNRGFTIPITVIYDATKLESILQIIAQSLDRNARNATVAYSGVDVSIVPEVTGRRLSLPKTIETVTAQFNNELNFSIPLVVEEITPTVFAADLESIDSLLASYSTQFDAFNTNRTENISLAARSINGMLVKKGEIFSFNRNVGPRLAEYGYKEAPVFIEGKIVPDWGGGVCQVSSTLYNAVLLADMVIEERTSHFYPPGYVPIGQDATVADNLLDFQFKNSSEGNIYIKSEVSGNQLTIYILGKRLEHRPDIQVVATDTKVLEPRTIIKQDSTLDLGTQITEVEGQKGFQVTTYRIKKANDNKEISRELLANDEFKPVDKVIRVGIKALPKQNAK